MNGSTVVSIARSRVRDCLYDVHFPAGKDEIMAVAVRNECEDAITALRAIPTEIYANVAEVLACVTLADGSARVPSGAGA
jgi:hypothetical protein